MRAYEHKISVYLIACLLSVVIILAGCSQGPNSGNTQPVKPGNPPPVTRQPAGPPDKVEVAYFYKSIPPPCECLAHAGEYVKTTMTGDFAREIESGKLVFHYLASDQAQNTKMVKKYNPAPFSLWINVTRGESEQMYSVDMIWEYLYDEPRFKQTIRDYVGNALKGQT
jgi:hypothetical protein